MWMTWYLKKTTTVKKMTTIVAGTFFYVSIGTIFSVLIPSYWQSVALSTIAVTALAIFGEFISAEFIQTDHVEIAMSIAIIIVVKFAYNVLSFFGLGVQKVLRGDKIGNYSLDSGIFTKTLYKPGKASYLMIIWIMIHILLYSAAAGGLHYLTTMDNLSYGLWGGLGCALGAFIASVGITIGIFIFDYNLMKRKSKKKDFDVLWVINSSRAFGIGLKEVLLYCVQYPLFIASLIFGYLVMYRHYGFDERIAISAGIGVYAAMGVIVVFTVKVLFKLIPKPKNEKKVTALSYFKYPPEYIFVPRYTNQRTIYKNV